MKLPAPNGWGHLAISLALLGISLAFLLTGETPAAIGIITAVSAAWGLSYTPHKPKR